MKKLCLPLAAALLGVVPAAHAVGSLAEVSVYDRGARRDLPTYEREGQVYVAGQPGGNYEIRVRNRSGEDLLAVVSMDGVNVVTGQTASPEQSGYVVGTVGQVSISGWRKSLDQVAAFYFTDLGDSYAARTGRPEDVGVIGVALFKRKAEPRADLRQQNRQSADRSARAPAAPAAR